MQPDLDGTGPVPGAVAALVALKASESAKSRLAGLPSPLRRRLAWTMALDTLGTLAAVIDVVCVVSDRPGLAHRLGQAGLPGIEVVPERGREGLNAALVDGAAHLRATGRRNVLACVGDLPALHPDSLRAVLRGASAPRSFLPDASGVGTTMLIARDVDLDPRFQGSSAAKHRRSGAVALTDAVTGPVPDARRDVDTEADLADAAVLGLGPASRALFDPATDRMGRYAAIEVVQRRGSRIRAVTAAGDTLELSLDGPAADEPDRLGSGQRWHVVLADRVVLSAWR